MERKGVLGKGFRGLKVRPVSLEDMFPEGGNYHIHMSDTNCPWVCVADSEKDPIPLDNRGVLCFTSRQLALEMLKYMKFEEKDYLIRFVALADISAWMAWAQEWGSWLVWAHCTKQCHESACVHIGDVLAELRAKRSND